MYWKEQKIDVTKDNKEYIMPIKFGKNLKANRANKKGHYCS